MAQVIVKLKVEVDGEEVVKDRVEGTVESITDATNIVASAQAALTRAAGQLISERF